MFFPETEIAQTLHCPLCKSGLEDPRLVPCGETICNGCVQLNTSAKQFGLMWGDPKFKCVCEQREHSIPAEGFPVNKVVATLIEKKPVAISRGADAKQLSARLQKIVAYKNKLLERDCGKETVVRNYFDFVRHDVEKAAESIVREAMQIKEGFLRTIGQFEARSLERIQSDVDFKPKFQKAMAETERFVESWTKYLATPSISSEQIERAIDECGAIEKLLDREHDRMRTLAFNNRVPSFKVNPKKLDKGQMGTLSIEFLEKLMFDKMSFVEFASSCAKEASTLAIDCLQNENVVCLSCVQQETAAPRVRYRLATYDSNSNPLHQFTLPFDLCASQKDNYHLVTFQNQAIFALTGPNSKHQYQQQQHVYVFDENLKVQAQMPYQTLNSEIQCIDADAEFVYVLAGAKRQERAIYKFNWKLEPQAKPAMSKLDAAKSLKYTKHMYVRQSYLFLLNQEVDEILVLDKTDGSLVKKLVNIDITNLDVLLSNDKIILKDDQTNRIKFYDLAGDLETEIQIDKRTLSKLKISVNKATDGLIFYDDTGVYF